MTFEAKLTAFMLIKATPKWLSLTVAQRFEAFETEILPVLREKVDGVRSRFYDTEFYSVRVSDIWVWEARDHESYQLLVDALRETPFWDHYFEVVDLLIGVEDAYAKNTGRQPVASVGN